MLTNGDWAFYYTLRGQVAPVEIRLLEARHSMASNKMHRLTLKFENHDNRLSRPDLAKFLFIGAEVTFTYGYLDDMGRTYTYVIMDHKDFDVLTVEAYPYLPKLLTPQRRRFKKSKRSDVAKLMAQESGLGTRFIEDTSCQEKSFSQTNKSNWKWLEDNARELNLEFGVDDAKKELIWRKRPYNQKPEFKFVWRLASIIGDIKKFRPKKNTFQIPGAFKSVWVDPASGAAKTHDVDGSTVSGRDMAGADKSLAGSSFLPPLKKVTTKSATIVNLKDLQVKPTGKSGEVAAIIVPQKKSNRKKKETIECKTEDLYRRAEDQYVEAKMTLVGQPKLRDKKMIELVGLGGFYDGPWYTLEVEHILGVSSGYETECVIETNSAGKLTGPNVTKGGKANNQVVKVKPGAARATEARKLDKKPERTLLA